MGEHVWLQYADPRDGRPYFFNAATGVTQWSQPEGEGVTVLDASTAMPEASAADVAAAVKKLEERRLKETDTLFTGRIGPKLSPGLTKEQREKEVWYWALGSGWQDRSGTRLDWRHYLGWSLFASLMGYFVWNGLTGRGANKEQEEDARRRASGW